VGQFWTPMVGQISMPIDTFDLSMLHDQGEIRHQGKDYNPRIAFDNFSGKLICSSEESNLHEYAFGNTSEAYGE
ncbi:hypothetical protein, partial [Trichlorobacter lovleyi]|uniref:hypothetical protein n=1 Tax=Trichlorobacter lovleyi TaxID=313985 RepID=UPI003D127506